MSALGTLAVTTEPAVAAPAERAVAAAAAVVEPIGLADLLALAELQSCDGGLVCRDGGTGRGRTGPGPPDGGTRSATPAPTC